MTSFSIFSTQGIIYVLRWLHYFFGIIWIGHLYYFNFTQGAFLKEKEVEPDTQTRSKVTRFLLPRALWWFRWGAMGTFLTGFGILGLVGHQMGAAMFTSSWGIAILTGAALASLMWANVWFVIWPAQQVVIASANAVATGGQANPQAAAAGARALLASRTNTAFSIPMLFFMGAASHLPLNMNENSSPAGVAALVLGVMGLLEANVLFGKMRKPLEKVGAVIHTGMMLTVILYFCIELMY